MQVNFLQDGSIMVFFPSSNRQKAKGNDVTQEKKQNSSRFVGCHFDTHKKVSSSHFCNFTGSLLSASFSANFGISNIEIKVIMVGGERWGMIGGCCKFFLRKSLHHIKT